jgi:transposase-like protein
MEHGGERHRDRELRAETEGGGAVRLSAPVFDNRMMRGESIAREFGWVRRVDETTYKVHSQSRDAEYDVISGELGWICSCPDSQYRGMKCKHVWAVEISWTLRKKVEQSVVIQPVNVKACPRCDSEDIKRSGLRHNQSGDIQRFACKSCGFWFSVNVGFERMKATPQTVTMAMQLYFSGLSFASTAKALRLKGVKVSGVSVFKWVRKYVGLMEGYLDQITPQVGDIWRTDEMYVKIRGNLRYLFAMMDDETRFRVAQMVSARKGSGDVRPMFREAQERAGKKPRILISDGAPNFAIANVKEWYTRYADDRTKHIADTTLEGEIHNNKMERQNGEVRDREKVMRGLKREDSPVLKGFEIYHNFFRPHMGLKGKTPAEAAGIRIEGENPWVTVIQNAAKLKAEVEERATRP